MHVLIFIQFLAFFSAFAVSAASASAASALAASAVTGDKDIGIDTMQWRLNTLGRHWIDR